MFVITVPSSDGTKKYTVRKVADSVWVCDCPDHVNRSHGAPFVCKHIAEVASSLFSFALTAKKSKKAEELLPV